MVKTLQRHGNSHALVLDKALLELLNITPETQLQIQVSNGSLVVTPVNVGVSEDEVAASIARLRPRYKQMLECLAE